MDYQQFLQWETRSRDVIDVKRCYIDIAEDIVAGVLLSQIIYWHLPDKNGSTKLQIFRDGFHWLAKERGDWWEECRITPTQYDLAVKKLRKKNIVATANFGFHGNKTAHIRIDWDVFFKLLEELPPTPKMWFKGSRKPSENSEKKPRKKAKSTKHELTTSLNMNSDEFTKHELTTSLNMNSQLHETLSCELTDHELLLYTEITPEITTKITHTKKDPSAPKVASPSVPPIVVTTPTQEVCELSAEQKERKRIDLGLETLLSQPIDSDSEAEALEEVPREEVKQKPNEVKSTTGIRTKKLGNKTNPIAGQSRKERSVTPSPRAAAPKPWLLEDGSMVEGFKEFVGRSYKPDAKTLLPKTAWIASMVEKWGIHYWEEYQEEILRQQELQAHVEATGYDPNDNTVVNRFAKQTPQELEDARKGFEAIKASMGWK